MLRGYTIKNKIEFEYIYIEVVKFFAQKGKKSFDYTMRRFIKYDIETKLFENYRNNRIKDIKHYIELAEDLLKRKSKY